MDCGMLSGDGNVLLSAALIVRNEELVLADCLQSLKAIVDEIVIVDTGSDDRTESIARAFNAKVSHFPWRDDFAAARNEALAHCRGKWILYIDADERVDAIEREDILPFLLEEDSVAFTVRFHPKTGYTPYPEHRIFRNHPNIQFQGRIHETFLPSLKIVAKEEQLSIGEIPLTIRHLGYDDDQTHKHQRNLPLLRREITHFPDRVYLWWHLGCVLKALDDEQGALEAWTKGVNIVRRQDSYRWEDSLPFGELIRLYFDRGIDTGKLLKEALQRFPDQYFLLWLKAMIGTQQQHYFEASKIFEQLVAINSEDLKEPLAYEAGIFGKLSYEPLAACYYKLGKFKESAACYKCCEQYEPANSAYTIKRRFLEATLAGRNDA